MSKALHLFRLSSFIIAGCMLIRPSVSAQSLFNKAFAYEDNIGNLDPLTGPSGFLICSTVRYGWSDLIGGFQFTRFDSTGSVIQSSAFSTGPIYDVMQNISLVNARTDGSFSFLFGSHPYNGPYRSSLRLFNTTTLGEVNWNRKIDYVNMDYSIETWGAMEQTFEETPDAGYLISALRKFPSGSMTDTIAPMIVKLDSTGDILWNKTYDLGETTGWHIISNVDTAGNLLFGFHADTPGIIVSDNCILTKIDLSGNTLWSKRIVGLNGRLSGSALVDGHYVISAEDSTSMYILEMDSAGNPLWGKRYAFAFPLWTWGAGIIPTHDHGFVLRKLVPDSIGGYNTFFFKVDSLGIVEWERLYGNGHQYPIDLVENKDSTFAMLSLGELGFVLSGLDPTGLNPCITPVTGWLTPTTFSFSLIDITLDEFAPPMISQPLYVNDSTSSDPQMLDACLFDVAVADHVRADELLIYPNPTSGSVSIRIDGRLLGASLIIVDLMGKQILRTKLSSVETVLDLGSFPSGAYLYQAITLEGRRLSGRLIKE